MGLAFTASVSLAGDATRLTIDQDVLKEASGVAVSRRNPDLLWAHNDSGDWSTLYAISTQGHYRGRVDILGADALDWEDIAAFGLDGKPWLLIADVGDNFSFRSQVSLYLLPEPTLEGIDDDFTIDADIVRRIDFSYSDGPRDVEAVAVDAANSKIYLLSKRDQPPVLYELPLRSAADAKQPLIAKRIGVITQIPEVTEQELRDDPKFGRFRNQPTALDISTDGRYWLLTTYKQAFLYTRATGQSLASMFAQAPQVIPLLGLPQVEAGGLSPNGDVAYFLSERLPTELIIKPLD